MAIEFEVSTVLNVPPDVLYHAWLDSAQHTAMTGGIAELSDQVGGEFSAWNGYIRGQNLELSPPRRIVQAWRTSEFEDSEADSPRVWPFLILPEKDRRALPGQFSENRSKGQTPCRARELGLSCGIPICQPMGASTNKAGWIITSSR